MSLLHAELVKVLAAPDMRKRLLAAGLEPVGSAPQEYDAHIRGEIAKWARVIRAAGIKPE